MRRSAHRSNQWRSRLTVDEDQAFWIKVGLRREPRCAPGGDVGPCLLAGVRSFFEGEVAPVKEAPDGARREPLAMLALQQRDELDQRDVHLPINRRKDHRAERFDPRRVSVTAARLGSRRPRLVPRAQPAHRGRHPNPEALHCSVARQTALHRRDHPNP